MQPLYYFNIKPNKDSLTDLGIPDIVKHERKIIDLKKEASTPFFLGSP